MFVGELGRRGRSRSRSRFMISFITISLSPGGNCGTINPQLVLKPFNVYRMELDNTRLSFPWNSFQINKVAKDCPSLPDMLWTATTTLDLHTVEFFRKQIILSDLPELYSSKKDNTVKNVTSNRDWTLDLGLTVVLTSYVYSFIPCKLH